MEMNTMVTQKNDTRVLVSTLWIVVMFSMAFADILGLFLPGAIETIISGSSDGVTFTESLMLVSAIMVEIPILLIFISRFMKYKWNRRLNIIGAIITIAFVVGGGSATLPYYLFATIEVICLIYIIITVVKWKENKKN